MHEPNLAISLDMIPSPRGIKYTGLKKGQYPLNATLFLIKMTYKPLMKQLLFIVKHSLRGKKDKIIQASQNNCENTKKPDTEEHDHQHTRKRQPEPHQDTQASNSITFPSIKDNHCNTKPQEDDQSFNEQYGHGKRSRPPPGAFKDLNEGLIATITIDLDDNNKSPDEQIDDVDRHPNCFGKYPPDVALVGQSFTDPKTLDEALQGPNAKQWQEAALQYEINQLKKLGKWVVEDLPQGTTPIPCSEVIEAKCSPKKKVQSYQVTIVARGHRQVEGINYSGSQNHPNVLLF